jgi:hypothetical protein
MEETTGITDINVTYQGKRNNLDVGQSQSMCDFSDDSDFQHSESPLPMLNEPIAPVICKPSFF